MPTARKDIVKLAFYFVLIIGAVNLFADMTYEGAWSVNGAFLASLGASSVVVGFVVGFGELIGYALRSVTGFFADKTHKYWVFTFVGYAINLLAVPALALAGSWPIAAALIIAERTGRAIRKPSVETMLSYSGRELGNGWVFGLNEFLDQFGATVGPLIVALVLFLKGTYRNGYAILLVSALLGLAILVIARLLYPKPQDLDQRQAAMLETKSFSKPYWIYVAMGMLVAIGFVDFSIIAFHFEKTGIVTNYWIPVFYAVAMATAGLSALLLGKFLDRIGSKVILVAMFLGAISAPFVFFGTFQFILVGMILWGIGMGAQDSLFKAALTPMIGRERRSTAFGLFDTAFGVAWFLGTATMGILYAKSIPALVIFSVIMQLAAMPVFAKAVSGEKPTIAS